MKFSIVMSYFNRRDQLIRTLRTIELSKCIGETEIIVVDDGSEPEHMLSDLPSVFPFLKVIRMDPAKKNYVNPCVPFNAGFRAATGDIVVLQNPECLHTGDILQHLKDNLHQEDYFTYSCYSISKPMTLALSAIDWTAPDRIQQLSKSISPLQPVHMWGDGSVGWYNHPKYRAVGFHFTAALWKSELDDLGGFDERYAPGSGYDDNEFLVRVARKGLHIQIVPEPIVIHQWHPTLEDRKTFDWAGSLHRNEMLFVETTMKETTWKVNNAPR